MFFMFSETKHSKLKKLPAEVPRIRVEPALMSDVHVGT